MSTLNELKDWIEQGGKIAQNDWCGNKYIKKDGDEWVADDGVKAGLGPEMALASDWVKVEEDTRWKPTGEEYYYFINDEFDSGIGKYACENDTADDNLYSSYNCFKTRKEAEQTRALWLAERELRSLADGGKYFIYYDIKNHKFLSGFLTFPIHSPYRFSTKDKADASIKQLGEDKLKLIYGVK